MPNKELGIADPVYDALRIRSGQSIAPDLGGGSFGTGGVENKIYLWHTDGSAIDTFDPDAAGLGLALAAAVSGDTIWLPSVPITASPTIPSNIVVIGIDIANSIIVGSVTNNGSLQNLSVTGNVTNNNLMTDVIVNVSSGVGITQVSGTLDTVRVIASGTTTYCIDYQGGYIYNCHTSYTAGTPTGIKINLPSFPGEIDRCLFAGEPGCEFITAPVTVISNCQFEGTQNGSGLVFTGAGSGHISNSRFYWRPTGTGFGIDVQTTGLTLTDCAWTSINGIANITYGTGDRGAYSVEDYHAADIEANVLTRHLTQPTGSAADAGKCDILNASGTAWELSAVPVGTGSGSDSFVNDVANGTLSSELFTLAHGVNEFDLAYEGGYYHWFYTTYEAANYNVHHRAALTIMGLATATDTVILSSTTLVVPTAILVGSTWHLWVTTEGTRNTHHYTASNPDGPWTFADDVSGEVGDPHVRKWDIDDNYYMAYVDDSTNWKIGLKRSSSTSGPWTDLGYIFSVLGKESWYTLESDPAIFFRGTRAYVSFSGWDNVSTQRCGLVEVNTTSWKALQAGTIIVEPTEAWMQRNADRVYNPVWLEHDGVMYFSQNPYNGGYAPNIVTGWGYIQPAHPGLSVLDTATVDLTLVGQLLTADVIPGGIDAADLASGAATNGQVLTADGVGGSSWQNHVDPINIYNETQSADGVSLTYYLTNYAAPSTIRVYIDGIRQPASDDSAATDVVTFDVAPDAGALLLFDYEMDTA